MHAATHRLSNPTRDWPITLLRLEGLALFVACSIAFGVSGGTLGWFLATLLLPDVSLLGYLVNPRVGAAVYDAGHTTTGPLVLGIATLLLGGPAWIGLGALVWLAHIGMDRCFGYGLKRPTHFHDTHLAAPRAN